MKRVLAAATIGLIALAMAASSSAAPATPQVAALERRLAWTEQHIRQLNHRRAFLHRYIGDLRAKLHPAATPSSSSGAGSPPSIPVTTSGGWADELAQVGFPASAIPHMLYIIQRESGGCPTAVYGYGCNGTGHAYAGGPACGLTQLYPCPGPGALDPMTNLRYALMKYHASGFAPWGG